MSSFIYVACLPVGRCWLWGKTPGGRKLNYPVNSISLQLRFFDLILPKYKIFGASERAVAMSSLPSLLKSPTAKPYTVPFESPKEIDLKLRPIPSLKNTDD